MPTRDQWGTGLEKRPIWTGIKIIAILILLGWGLSALGFFSSFFANGAKVVQKEFWPEALLAKYEWFKDAAAKLDSLSADIKVYEAKNQRLVDSYKDVPRAKWDRTDKEQEGLWEQEVAGIKAGYNDLAGRYNAQMVKFNWRFTNVGDLPPGATDPLPRSYKPYQEK